MGSERDGVKGKEEDEEKGDESMRLRFGFLWGLDIRL